MAWIHDHQDRMLRARDLNRKVIEGTITRGEANSRLRRFEESQRGGNQSRLTEHFRINDEDMSDRKPPR